jgi:hypothetical protein
MADRLMADRFTLERNDEATCMNPGKPKPPNPKLAYFSQMSRSLKAKLQ